MSDLLTGMALGVGLTCASAFVVLAVRSRKRPATEQDPVQAENVITIERWKERRAAVDETFGRRA